MTHGCNLAAEESGLECARVNNNESVGAVELLSEHIYCVAFAFKLTERVEQRICIRFYIKLKLMIQKSTAVGNW